MTSETLLLILLPLACNKANEKLHLVGQAVRHVTYYTTIDKYIHIYYYICSNIKCTRITVLRILLLKTHKNFSQFIYTGSLIKLENSASKREKFSPWVCTFGKLSIMLIVDTTASAAVSMGTQKP